ncbi:MAG: VWA domain-containing protein [Candidatus Jordarchaeales archaeon]
MKEVYATFERFRSLRREFENTSSGFDIDRALDILLQSFGSEIVEDVRRIIEGGKVKFTSLEVLVEFAHKLKNLTRVQRNIIARIIENPKVGSVGERNIIRLLYEVERLGEKSVSVEFFLRQMLGELAVSSIDGRDLPSTFRECGKLSEQHKDFLKFLLSRSKFTQISSYCIPLLVSEVAQLDDSEIKVLEKRLSELLLLDSVNKVEGNSIPSLIRGLKLLGEDRYKRLLEVFSSNHVTEIGGNNLAWIIAEIRDMSNETFNLVMHRLKEVLSASKVASLEGGLLLKLISQLSRLGDKYYSILIRILSNPKVEIGNENNLLEFVDKFEELTDEGYEILLEILESNVLSKIEGKHLLALASRLRRHRIVKPLDFRERIRNVILNPKIVQVEPDDLAELIWELKYLNDTGYNTILEIISNPKLKKITSSDILSITYEVKVLSDDKRFSVRKRLEEILSNKEIDEVTSKEIVSLIGRLGNLSSMGYQTIKKFIDKYKREGITHLKSVMSIIEKRPPLMDFLLQAPIKSVKQVLKAAGIFQLLEGIGLGEAFLASVQQFDEPDLLSLYISMLEKRITDLDKSELLAIFANPVGWLKGGLHLNDVKGDLMAWLTPLCGSIPIVPSKDGPRSDGKHIYLPSVINEFPDKERNMLLYLYGALHAVSHIRYGSFAIPLSKLYEEFKKTGHSWLATVIFTALEDARCEDHLIREFSELEPLVRTVNLFNLRKRTIQSSPSPLLELVLEKIVHGKTKGEHLEELLKQDLLEKKGWSVQRAKAYIELEKIELEKYSELIEQAVKEAERVKGGTVLDSVETSLKLVELLKDYIPEPPESEQAESDMESSENQESVIPSEEFSTDKLQELKEKYAEQLTARVCKTTIEEAEEAHSMRKVPEWDEQFKTYSLWINVDEIRIQKGAPIPSLYEYSYVRQQLINELEKIVPRKFKVERRVLDGSELNMDGIVDAHCDRREKRIFDKIHRDSRDVAAVLLIDASGSTSRIINSLKISAILFGDACNALGDKFAIYAFNTEGRKARIYIAKDFDEPWTATIQERVGAVRSGGLTRMGAPIRYSYEELLKREAKTKIMFVFSDGEPEGYEQEENAIPDVKVAIEEAESKGIRVVYITMGREPRHLKEMCSAASILKVIKSPEELPWVLIGNLASIK